MTITARRNNNTPSRRVIPGIPRRPIYLEDVKPRGLIRAQLGLPLDQSDVKAHIDEAVSIAIDKTLEALNIPLVPGFQKLLLKGVVEYVFEIPRDEPNWEVKFAALLLTEHVPALRVKPVGSRRRGGQREWTRKQYAQLYADVGYIMSSEGKSARQACKELRTREGGYARRWRRYKPDRLRQAFAEAAKLRWEDFGFRLELGGHDFLRGSKGLVESAIGRHALKA